MIIGFAGLSHLGVVSSVAAAAKGFKVIGYGDYDELKRINSNTINITEPNLNKVYVKFKQNILFTDKITNLQKADIIYISKDVPTDNKGNSKLKYVNEIIKKISKFKRKKILVILSQVPPGFTRNLKWNNERLYYQVETLVLGQALKRALKPERIIIGSQNPSLKININLNKFIKKFDCPIIKMKYESAELAKISINMYLISSIITTNSLAELSKKIGADWNYISQALRSDRRIGRHAYLQPGLGISGGNLERDLVTIIKCCKHNNIDNKIFKTWKQKSYYFKKWAYQKFFQLKKKNIKTIAILGLAYKAKTNSIKNSPSLLLINKLKHKYNINIFDPVIKKIDSLKIKFANSIYESIKGADVLFIMTPWDQFQNLKISLIKKIMRGNVIIDPYQLLRNKNMIKYGFDYFSL